MGNRAVAIRSPVLPQRDKGANGRAVAQRRSPVITNNGIGDHDVWNERSRWRGARTGHMIWQNMAALSSILIFCGGQFGHGRRDRQARRLLRCHARLRPAETAHAPPLVRWTSRKTGAWYLAEADASRLFNPPDRHASASLPCCAGALEIQWTAQQPIPTAEQPDERPA